MSRPAFALSRFGEAGTAFACRLRPGTLPLALAAVMAGGGINGAAPGGQAHPPEHTAAMWFTDATREVGIDFRHVNGASPDKHLVETMGSGGLFFDYDDDGWIDLFLVDGGSFADPTVARRARHRLFRNRGNGTFQDITAQSGIQHRDYGMGACAGDYDNDGRVDLYFDERRAEHAVPQRRRRQVHRCHPGRPRRFTAVEHQLRLRGSRQGRRPRSLRHQLRDHGPCAQPVLRKRQAERAQLLPSAHLRPAAEHPLPQRRQRNVHRCQRGIRDGGVARQRTRRRHRGL